MDGLTVVLGYPLLEKFSLVYFGGVFFLFLTLCMAKGKEMWALLNSLMVAEIQSS